MLDPGARDADEAPKCSPELVVTISGAARCCTLGTLFGRRLAGLCRDLMEPLLGPVIDIVILESLGLEPASEELAKIRVVGPDLEAQRPGVVNVGGKLLGEGITTDVPAGEAKLLSLEQLVSLFFCRSVDVLPRQRAEGKITQHVSDGF